jgi:ABC-type multidrug transport system ATPase subunit
MLQLKNLTLYRNGKTICRDLFLEIGKGSCLVINGKNGSGKSSIISCLVGQLNPTSGQILLDHHDLHRLNHREKKLFLQSTGIVFQQESLRPFDSVSSLISKYDLKESTDLLSTLGIPQDIMIHELSYSQRRKLELAMAIMKDPKLLVWDEPFMGIDMESQEQVKAILLKKKISGTTLIIGTNFPEGFSFLNPEKILKL